MAEDLLSFTPTELQPMRGVSIAGSAPSTFTVRVLGDVDAVGAPLLDAALDVVWDDAPRDLVVDLTDVTFLSISGLHALVRAWQTAQRRAARLTLRTASRHLDRLLASAGVGDATRSRDGGRAGDAPEERGRRSWETPPDDDPLLRTVRVGAAWCSAGSVQSSLESVCATAVATIPGAEGAGIVLADGDHHRSESRAATDGRARALDVVREGLGRPMSDGRHPDPAWVDGAVVVDELGRDPRWPELAARAAQLQVGSVLCLGIGAARPLGVLTLYSSRPRAFTAEAVRLGRILAAVAAIALSAAQRQQQLTRAVSTRDVIGQAKGILMERHKITAEQAFLVLSRASSLRNTKLAELAARAAETGEL